MGVTEYDRVKEMGVRSALVACLVLLEREKREAEAAGNWGYFHRVREDAALASRLATRVTDSERFREFSLSTHGDLGMFVRNRLSMASIGGVLEGKDRREASRLAHALHNGALDRSEAIRAWELLEIGRQLAPEDRRRWGDRNPFEPVIQPVVQPAE